MNTSFKISKEKKQSISKIFVIEILLNIFGILIVIANLIAHNIFPQQTSLLLYIIAYILIGHEIIYVAIKNLLSGIVMPNLLISSATFGAFLLGNQIHAIGILLFFRICEYLQNLAIDKSKKRISSALNLKPQYISLQCGDEVKKVPPEDIKVGDIIIVKVGERVALDGEVSKGESVLDTSALTGESKPKAIKHGENILSGVINLGSILEVEVTADINNSTISKIIELINDAATKKSKAETFITRFSKVYTPAVTIISVLILIAPIVIKQMTFADSLSKALSFLVISVPCSLVLSIPLAFFIAIGVCSKRGILVKGSNYLDAMNNIDTIVFDKTGTLTKGVFRIIDIATNKTYDKNQVLEYIALAEYYSNHYIAKSILQEVQLKIDKNKITAHEEIAGFGIKAVINNRNILVGSSGFLKLENIEVLENEKVGTKVYLSIDGFYAGCITLSDELKDDTIKLCENLKQIGISKLVMLTGDNEKQANEFSKLLKIDKVYAGLLPQDKVKIVEEIKQGLNDKKKVVFVGDGINDAPVIAVSDIGIAMGNGADIAIETADIILMTDEPTKIIQCIKVARETRKIVMQVVIMTILVKIIFLSLTWIGVVTLFVAICSDLGMSLISVLSCIRILNIKDD